MNATAVGGEPKKILVYLKADPDGSDSVRGKSATSMKIVVIILVSNRDIITESG